MSTEPTRYLVAKEAMFPKGWDEHAIPRIIETKCEVVESSAYDALKQECALRQESERLFVEQIVPALKHEIEALRTQLEDWKLAAKTGDVIIGDLQQQLAASQARVQDLEENYAEILRIAVAMRMASGGADDTSEEAIERIRSLRQAEQQRDRLRTALESIAKNTCCGSCQEAKLVAQQALRGEANAVQGP